jgi:hypothetical protein
VTKVEDVLATVKVVVRKYAPAEFALAPARIILFNAKDMIYPPYRLK